MPSKVDHIRVGKARDKRRSTLTDEQRAEIKQRYGKDSQRALAAEFGVSRRTISFIGDPAQMEKHRAAYHKRGGWRRYYDKEKHTGAMARHRAYKKEIADEIKSITENA